MSNEIEEKDEMYDSASIEVKEGFFSKLFSSFGRKALPPASGAVKTNASMSSLMARGSIRAALVNLGNRIQNVFTPKKEVTPTSTLSAHVIGENNKDGNSLDKTKSDDEAVLSAEQPHIFIPTPKSVTANRRTTVLNNNSNLSIEKMDVDSEAIVKDSEPKIDDTELVNETEKNQPVDQGLHAVDIAIDNKEQKSKDIKPSVEHEQGR